MLLGGNVLLLPFTSFSLQISQISLTLLAHKHFTHTHRQMHGSSPQTMLSLYVSSLSVTFKFAISCLQLILDLDLWHDSKFELKNNYEHDDKKNL